MAARSNPKKRLAEKAAAESSPRRKESQGRRSHSSAYREHRGFEVRGMHSPRWTEDALLDTSKKYARELVAGRWPACLWTRLAAKRFLDDIRNSRKAAFPYKLDLKKAVRAARFLEMCRLTAGEMAGRKQRLRLIPWQTFAVINLFGWVKKTTGQRRFTEAYLKLPRKTGKSEFAAAIGLYMLVADGEFGAQCFSGARTRDQAMKVFKPASVMVRQDKDLQKKGGLQVWGGQRNPDEITHAKSESFFRPLIGKPGDGDNPHYYACDEYHQHATDEQYAAMKTGMSNRSQSLLLVITTAGSDLSSPCASHEEEAKKVIRGDVKLEHWFILMFGIDSKEMSPSGEADDWKSPDALAKANHSIGFTQPLENLLMRLEDALAKGGSFINDYKTKYLNIWVGSRECYFDIERWQTLGRDKRPARAPAEWKPSRDPVDLSNWKGRRIFFGLDMADKWDLCALAAFSQAPDGYYEVWSRFWLPEETVQSQPPGHKYKRWAEEPSRPLRVTPGAMVDGRQIAKEIIEITRAVGHEKFAYDPAHAAGVVPILEDKRIKLVEFGNSPLNMSDPMQMLNGFIRDRRIRHNDQPVLTECMSNIAAKPSAQARDLHAPIRTNPADPKLKIDGGVALMMAMGVWIKAPTAPSGPTVVRLN